MPWLPVTITDLEGWIQKDRLETAFASRAPGQKRVSFDVIAAGVVARIRAKVAQQYPLDADPNTVPPELHELACLTVASQVLARLGVISTDASGGVFTLTREQRDRLKLLEADLDSISQGKMAVSPVDGGSDGAEPYTPNRVELAITPGSRRLSRTATEGL